MFVMQLVGRQADTIIDMPFAEAKACMENGTVRQATQEEITAALDESRAPVAHMTTDQLMAGYRIEASETGYNVFDAGGVKINEDLLRNQLEAREFTLDYSRRVRGLPEDLFRQQQDGGGTGVTDGSDVDYNKLTVEELQAEAKNRGLDTSSASKKADWVGLLKRDDKVKAALAAEDYETLTVAELKKVAADRQVDLGEASTKSDIIAKLKAPATAAVG